MKLLLDTNVALDVIANRAPFAAAMVPVWQALESGKAEGHISAHAVPTIAYWAGKGGGAPKAAVELLLTVLRVAPVTEAVLRRALALDWRDYEDALAAAVAEAAGCDVIVTRNGKDFTGSPVRVMNPRAAAAMLSISG